MADLRIHWVKEPGADRPRLAAGEDVLWAGGPNRLEYFLFWLPRAALPAALWAAIWLWAAIGQFDNGADKVAVGLPLVMAAAGVVCIIAVPISSIVARRYIYMITSSRVILFNKNSGTTRYVRNDEVDSRKLVKGWSAATGSLQLGAGTVDGPDGEAKIELFLVGIDDVLAANAALP